MRAVEGTPQKWEAGTKRKLMGWGWAQAGNEPVSEPKVLSRLGGETENRRGSLLPPRHSPIFSINFEGVKYRWRSKAKIPASNSLALSLSSWEALPLGEEGMEESDAALPSGGPFKRQAEGKPWRKRQATSQNSMGEPWREQVRGS